MERRHQAAGPQHRAALAAPASGSTQCQAVPAITASNFAASRLPVLERRRLDLDPGTPRELGHPRVGLDAEDSAARRLELPGLDASPQPALQHVPPGAGGNDPLYQHVGIGLRARS